MTGPEAMAALFTAAELAAETEIKALGQKELPIIINRLTIAETQHPGFLGIKKDLDQGLIEVAQLALNWCNS